MITGNEFTLIIPYDTKGSVSKVEVSLYDTIGKKYDVNAVMSETEELITAEIENLEPNKYSVEINGIKNGKRFRRYRAEAFTITIDGNYDEDESGNAIERLSPFRI